MHFVGRGIGGCTLFFSVEYLEFLVANTKCMQSFCNTKVCAVLLQCQSVCCLVPVLKCMHYTVLLLCQSVCTLLSCCSAKVYALCSLVAAPKCMHYAVLLQCQSVCSLVAVPKCMKSCCSAKVYAVLLQCQSVCRFVAVPKCMQICCSAKVYSVLLQCQSVCRFVAVPENLQFLQRGVSRSQRLLWPDHRRHLPLRGQQIPLQEVTTVLCGSLN